MTSSIVPVRHKPAFAHNGYRKRLIFSQKFAVDGAFLFLRSTNLRVMTQFGTGNRVAHPEVVQDSLSLCSQV
jgi:hypothetical protein